MGRKNRTRKTKWRQISLGSSEHEEEEDQQLEQHSDDRQDPQCKQQETDEVLDNSSSSTNFPPAEAEQFKEVNGYRPRRPYHRYHGNHTWSHGYGDHSRATGVERKIFDDEEYTKISTPRQEVLLKKGSIGKKKLSLSNAHAKSCDENEDTLNGNGSSSLESPIADLQSPVYCYPASYGGFYSQGVIMQEMYPGGPLLAAVPVSLLPQPVYPYYCGETYNDNQQLNDNERSRKNSGDSSQASGSTAQDTGSSEESENSSPEPLSPGIEASDALSSPDSQKLGPLPVLQYPSVVYMYPAGYALAPPVYTNG